MCIFLRVNVGSSLYSNYWRWNQLRSTALCHIIERCNSKRGDKGSSGTLPQRGNRKKLIALSGSRWRQKLIGAFSSTAGSSSFFISLQFLFRVKQMHSGYQLVRLLPIATRKRIRLTDNRPSCQEAVHAHHDTKLHQLRTFTRHAGTRINHCIKSVAWICQYACLILNRMNGGSGEFGIWNVY